MDLLRDAKSTTLKVLDLPSGELLLRLATEDHHRQPSLRPHTLLPDTQPFAKLMDSSPSLNQRSLLMEITTSKYALKSQREYSDNAFKPSTSKSSSSRVFSSNQTWLPQVPPQVRRNQLLRSLGTQLELYLEQSSQQSQESLSFLVVNQRRKPPST